MPVPYSLSVGEIGAVGKEMEEGRKLGSSRKLGNATPRVRDNVLILIELTNEGEKTLRWALSKCQTFDTVTALCVVASLPGTGGPRPINTVSEEELERYKDEIAHSCFALLSTFKDICELKQIQASVGISHGLDVKQVILEEAARSAATKIVIGDYGMNKRSIVRFFVDRIHPSSMLYFLKEGRPVCIKNGKGTTTLSDVPDGKTEQLKEETSTRSARSPWQNIVSNSKLRKGSWKLSNSISGSPARVPDSSQLSVEYAASYRSPKVVVEAPYKGFNSVKCGKSIGETVTDQIVSSSSQSNGDMAAGLSRSNSGLFNNYAFKWRRPSSKSGPITANTNLSFVSTAKSTASGRIKDITFKNSSVTGSRPSGNDMWSGTVLDTSESGQIWVPETPGSNNDKQRTIGWPFGMNLGVNSVSGLNSTGLSLKLPDDNLISPREDIFRQLPELHGMWTQFLKLEMVGATGDFSEKHLIGKGGFSKVYRGVLPSGSVVAVKRMFNEGAGDTHQEWQTEVSMMAAVRHRHIVGLLGFCVDSKERILVYEYMEKGNLEENLHDKRRPVLDWKVRVQIALGVARAVEYLHVYCPRSIIHRDIKASNILLDGEFNTKVADFGLAKWNPGSANSITAEVVGTFGYLAPEYFMYGKVNEKTDVYSYGVVLLELLTGRMPIDISGVKGEENLVFWAKPLLQAGKIEDLIDKRLEGNYNEGQARRVFQVAALCLCNNAIRRPSMSEVVRLIEEPLSSSLLSGIVATDISRQSSLGIEAEFSVKETDTQRWKRFTELALEDLTDETECASSSSCSIERPAVEDYLEGRMSREESLVRISAPMDENQTGDYMTSKNSDCCEIKVPQTGIWANIG